MSDITEIVSQPTMVTFRLGLDVHSAGVTNASKAARDLGYKVVAVPPSRDLNTFLERVQEHNPDIIGLSYRGKPEAAKQLMNRLIAELDANGLLERINGDKRNMAFAGLPESCDIVDARHPDIKTFKQSGDSEADLVELVEFFGAEPHYARAYAKKRLNEIAETPVDISDDPVLVNKAKAIIDSGEYLAYPKIGAPSPAAQESFVVRLHELRRNGHVGIRTHYGQPHKVPEESLKLTEKGIEEIAEAEVLAIVSLGSSQMSQEFFGQPEMWKREDMVDDGGVITRTGADLARLYAVTRRGSFPAMKTYSGTDSIEELARKGMEEGGLKTGFQAVPLEWFSQLDGRGPMSPIKAIARRMNLMRFFAENNVPLEINNPHHSPLRYGHDALLVADHVISALVAEEYGVKDYIMQMMFNTPLLSSWADYARMDAALDLVTQVRGSRPIVETRAGLMYFSTDLEKAKTQLATTTLLQMYFDPMLIHAVNYCEADHAATPEDVIESAKIVLTSAKWFRENRTQLPDFENHPRVVQRKSTLMSESRLILDTIARLNGYKGNKDIVDAIIEQKENRQYLASPEAIMSAWETGIKAMPGNIYEPYIEYNTATNVTPFTPGGSGGGWDVVEIIKANLMDPYDYATDERIPEAVRLERLGVLK